MVKYVFHLADIHIPNSLDGRPYDKMIEKFGEQFSKHVNELKESGVKEEEIRICVVGDLFHNKIKISNEARGMFHSFLNILNDLAPTIIIAGNHDMLENNKDKIDSITPTFDITGVYENVLYLDKELDYKSGFFVDDNIVWCLYSMFDNFVRPNNVGLDLTEDMMYIGLYHGNIPGATTDVGRVIEDGLDSNSFDLCSIVMCGHIHKHQMIRRNGVKMVYSSSLFQQNAGENITGHGYCLWNLEEEDFTFHEVENDYRILRFDIKSFEDFSEGKEQLINL